MHNVNLAGERQQRKLADSIVGDNISAEKGAFTFPTEKGGEEIREVPFVYVKNLIAKIADVLEHHERQVLPITSYTLMCMYHN